MFSGCRHSFLKGAFALDRKRKEKLPNGSPIIQLITRSESQFYFSLCHLCSMPPTQTQTQSLVR